MTKSFYFAGGHGFFGTLLEERLGAAGYVRVQDPGSTKLIVVFAATMQDHEDALYDEEGVVKNAQPGTLVIDLTTTAPRLARDLAAIAQSSNLALVEAPLVVVDPCGEDPYAHKGLACFVAGEEGAVDQARPVLDLMVGTVHVTGTESGSANLVRLSYAVQAAAQLLGTAEAMALFNGVCTDYPRIQAAVGGIGALTPLGTSLQNAVAQERFRNGYTVGMMLSELYTAQYAADEVGVVMNHLEDCIRVLELLEIAEGGQMSPAALALAYMEEAVATQHGLDFNRAAEVMMGEHQHSCGCGHDDCDCDEDCGDDCQCHKHDHGHDGAADWDEPEDDFGATPEQIAFMRALSEMRQAEADLESDEDDEDDDDYSPFDRDYDGWDTLRYDDDEDWK